MFEGFFRFAAFFVCALFVFSDSSSVFLICMQVVESLVTYRSHMHESLCSSLLFSKDHLFILQFGFRSVGFAMRD